MLILLTSKILQVFSGLIAVRLLTEYLSPTDLGFHYLISAVVALLSFGLLNPMGLFYGRFIVAWHQNNSLMPITKAFLFARLLLIVPGLIIAWGVFQFFNYKEFTQIYVYLPLITIMLIAQNHGFLLNVVNMLLPINTFAIYNIITTLFSLALSTILLLHTLSGYAWLAGATIAQCFIMIPLYLSIRNIEHYGEQRPDLNQSLRLHTICVYIAPVTVTLFLQWFMGSSYRIFTENTFSLEKLAELSIGLFISAAIFQNLETVLNQILMPRYLRRITSNSRQDRTAAINQLLQFTVPIYVTVLIYTMTLSPWLLQLLVSETYHHLYIYVCIGALIEFSRVISNQISNIAHSEIKPAYQMFSYIPGAVCLLIALLYIDQDDNIMYVLLALLLSQVIILSVLLWAMARLLRYELNSRGIIQKIFFMSPPLIFFYLIQNLHVEWGNHYAVVTMLLACLFGFIVFDKDLRAMK